MTQRQILRIVETWKKRMSLDGWEITIQWDRPLNPEEAFAEIVSLRYYDEAELRLASNYTTWDREEANRHIVHELMHLIERDLKQVVRALEKVLPPEAYVLLMDRYMAEVEGVIDRTANVLVDLGGAV